MAILEEIKTNPRRAIRAICIGGMIGLSVAGILICLSVPGFQI